VFGNGVIRGVWGGRRGILMCPGVRPWVSDGAGGVCSRNVRAVQHVTCCPTPWSSKGNLSLVGGAFFCKNKQKRLTEVSTCLLVY